MVAIKGRCLIWGKDHIGQGEGSVQAREKTSIFESILIYCMYLYLFGVVLVLLYKKVNYKEINIMCY